MNRDEGIDIGTLRLQVLAGETEVLRIYIEKPGHATCGPYGLEYDRAAIERYSDSRARPDVESLGGDDHRRSRRSDGNPFAEPRQGDRNLRFEGFPRGYQTTDAIADGKFMELRGQKV